MKAKKSEINILIMLIGILLAVISYFVVYNKFTEKREALAAENATLQSEVDALQQLADNKQFYIDETNRMDNEIQDILKAFPGEVRAEDHVIYSASLEAMFANTIWVNGLTLDETEMVYIATSSPETEVPTDDAIVEDTGDGTTDGIVPSQGLKDTVFLYSSPYKLDFKITYRSFKDVVQMILQSDERMSIQEITLSYDAETGCLAGSLDATTYTVTGTDYIYNELDVPGVRLGVSDIFKAGTVLDLNRLSSTGAEDEENPEGGEGGEGTSDQEAANN